MNNRETMRMALAECAAIAGQWCKLVDGARDDPDRLERLAGLVPRVMANIMAVAGDALEAAGYDVSAEVEAAVVRIHGAPGMEWH